MQKGNFKAAYKRLASKRDISLPLTATIEITQRCNFRCKFCYIDSKKREKEDLPLFQLKQILNNLHRLGIIRIILLGGEPFIRDDFLEIYSYLQEKGFLITLFTNASLIDKKKAKYISKFPPLNFVVGMYGITKNTYKNITRVEDSYGKFKKGVSLLYKNNIPFIFNILCNKLNEKELNSMQIYAESLSVSYNKTFTIAQKIDGDVSPCMFQCERYSTVQHKYNKCPGIIFINNAGDLNFCLLNRSFTYDLDKYDIIEVWKRKIAQKVNFNCPLK